MNSKGFYNSIIAMIAVVLVASMLFIQASATKTRQAEAAQRAIFDLKYGMQNMQYLLDKATADAMADCFDATSPTCTNNCGTDYSQQISTYFATVTNNANANFGISCYQINVPTPITNGNEFSFSLKCYKLLGNDFKVEYEKEITLSKTVYTTQVPPVPPAPGSCTIKVEDNQSGTCDVPQGTSPC